MDFLHPYLTEDLQRIQALIESSFRVHGDLMQEVARYVAAGRGKMVRPALVCLAARAHGLDPRKTDHHILLGASIELFHVATLLHDDVIDKAPTRRGRQTVNAKWGDDAAILFADYLYATSFDLSLATLRPETMRIMTKTTQLMTEGEFMQVERRGQWLTVDDYMEIIERKTARLFAAAASLGTLIAGADFSSIERMARFGLAFGNAFQITDDTLDYETQNDRWGKRVGADLAEGKQTLPLLHALRSATPTDREALLTILNDGRDFQTVQGYVKKYDGIDYALDTASNQAKTAMECLEAVEVGGKNDGNEAVELMKQMADFVVVRQY